MGGLNVIFIIQNIFIFCILFWVLTFVGEYFFKPKQHKTKKNFYECGFKSTVDINLQTNFNFILYTIFLILYDIEFLFFLPFFINLNSINDVAFLALILFSYLIIFSLIIDFLLYGLKWKI